MEEDFLLVKRCLEKDTAAFEKLIDKYQKPVFNLGMRMLGNSDDAADLTQNVFIKSWERLNTYNRQYKFLAVSIVLLLMNRLISQTEKKEKNE